MRLFSGIRDWPSSVWGIIFLLLVSLGIKVTALFSGDIINVDGVRYIDAARQFAQGNFVEGLRIDWMPFYSLLIAGFHFLVRDWVLAGQLISLLAMVLALVPLYLLTKGLFDEKVAFWTGLAFAVSPMLNSHAVGLLRDPIYIFFVLWSVYFCLRALRNENNLFFILTSLSLTFALCCRLEAILLWGIFLPILAVLAVKNTAERCLLLKGMSVLVGLPLVLGLLLGGGVLLFAGSDLASSDRSEELTVTLKKVVIGNSIAYYKRKVSKGVFDNYHSRYQTLKDLARSLYGWNNTGGVLETTRHYLPLIYLIGIAEALARNLFPLFVLPLLAGLWKCTSWHRGHWLILLLVGAYFLMAYYFLFTHDGISKRYILVPAVFLFPWVGRGLERIRAGVVKCRWPRIALVLFLLVFCGVPAYKSLGNFTGPGKGHAIREAGQWLAMQPDLQTAIIACSDPRIRFYSSQDLKFLKTMERYKVARDFRMMEQVAFDKKAELLIIETSKNKRRKMPEFKHYSLRKEIVGFKRDVLIYDRNI
jgi:hypothetical protein